MDEINIDDQLPNSVNLGIKTIYQSDMCKNHYTENLVRDVVSNKYLTLLSDTLLLGCNNNSGCECTRECEIMKSLEVNMSLDFIIMVIRQHRDEIIYCHYPDGEMKGKIKMDEDNNPVYDDIATENIIRFLSHLQYPMYKVLVELGVDYILNNVKIHTYLHDRLLDQSADVVDAQTVVFIASIGIFTAKEFASIQVSDNELTPVINAFENNYFIVDCPDVHGHLQRRKLLYTHWLNHWTQNATGIVNNILAYLQKKE